MLSYHTSFKEQGTGSNGESEKIAWGLMGRTNMFCTVSQFPLERQNSVLRGDKNRVAGMVEIMQLYI